MTEGDYWEWTCKAKGCGKIRWDELSEYIRFLLWVRRLRDAGFPMDDGDILELEQWADLGRLDDALNPPFQCPFLTKKKDNNG